MSFHDLQLYNGPVGVLPMMQEARAGVWQAGGLLSASVAVASDSERRRRRLEMYRQRHEANSRSYDVFTSAMANNQRQQTALLFQRWLDSRCKRTTVSRSKITKGEADTADPSTKSTIPVSNISYLVSTVMELSRMITGNCKFITCVVLI